MIYRFFCDIMPMVLSLPVHHDRSATVSPGVINIFRKEQIPLVPVVSMNARRGEGGLTHAHLPLPIIQRPSASERSIINISGHGDNTYINISLINGQSADQAEFERDARLRPQWDISCFRRVE